MKVKLALPLFMIFILFGFTSMRRAEINDEYRIKAAFIYKFTNYIDWGNYMKGDEFVIGVIGQSPVGNELYNLSKSSLIKGKKVSVHQYHAAEDISSCQILFISRKAEPPIYEILAYTREKGMLTISEEEGDASRGTQLNFVLVDNKLKFEANPRAINAAGLTASSQLLKLAIIVN